MREYGGYDVVGDTITVDSEDFVAKHILECGQVFRFESTNYGYELKAGKEICRLHEVGANPGVRRHVAFRLPPRRHVEHMVPLPAVAGHLLP